HLRKVLPREESQFRTFGALSLQVPLRCLLAHSYSERAAPAIVVLRAFDHKILLVHRNRSVLLSRFQGVSALGRRARSRALGLRRDLRVPCRSLPGCSVDRIVY